MITEQTPLARKSGKRSAPQAAIICSDVFGKESKGAMGPRSVFLRLASCLVDTLIGHDRRIAGRAVQRRSGSCDAIK
jgi:hypothetical protein